METRFRRSPDGKKEEGVGGRKGIRRQKGRKEGRKRNKEKRKEGRTKEQKEGGMEKRGGRRRE